MTKKKGRELEEYVEQRLAKLYPRYRCACQKPSKTTGRIPDCFCVLREKRDEPEWREQPAE